MAFAVYVNDPAGARLSNLRRNHFNKQRHTKSNCNASAAPPPTLRLLGNGESIEKQSEKLERNKNDLPFPIYTQLWRKSARAAFGKYQSGTA